MADGQDEGTDNTGTDGGENQNDDGTEGTDNSGQGQEGSEDGSGTETAATTTTVSKADFDKLMNRMKAADRRAAAAEKIVAEAEKAKMSDIEKAQAEAAEAKTKAETAAAAMKDLQIRNAFLSSTGITWHDPEDALRLADLSNIDVADDGTIDSKAVANVLKELAKNKPHLVKVAATEASGSANNGNRKGNQGKPDVAQQLSRFPALGRR